LQTIIIPKCKRNGHQHIFCNPMIRDRNWFHDPCSMRCCVSPSLPRVHHCYNAFSVHQSVDCLNSSLWSILLQCKWTNTIESSCVPKKSPRGNRYNYVAKTPCDVELEIDIVVSRLRLAFSDTLLESFYRTSRVRVRRSAARWRERRAHRDRNFFCVRIWYNKFPISDCIGDLDLGLCTCWVLAKREPLSKSNFRKRTRFARRKNQILPSLSGSLNASTQKEYRHRSQSPLHFDIRNS